MYLSPQRGLAAVRRNARQAPGNMARVCDLPAVQIFYERFPDHP